VIDKFTKLKIAKRRQIFANLTVNIYIWLDSETNKQSNIYNQFL